MKNLLTLSLMVGGLAGSVFAESTIASHKTDVSMAPSKNTVKIEKNQKVAWIPIPEQGNPHKPCIQSGEQVAWIPIPEEGNPNKPC